ncbi:MAG: hypothetical protein KA715_11910 [Xanthomonadaceae bacterium]|nr:hypothetical protein [Xanthomonadaceae bacterium]
MMKFRFIKAIFFVLAASLTACTPKIDPEISKGQFFSADANAIDQVTFTRLQEGKSWSASFNRKEQTPWEITSAPDSIPLLDRRANDKYLNHLVDSLTSVSNLKQADRGTDEQLGLAPPKWIIVVGTPYNSNALQLKLGGIDTQTGGVISSIDMAGVKGTHLLRGSFFGLLDHLKNFQYLRLTTLINKKPGDIFKIEIVHGKTKSSAERQVNEWIKKNKNDVSSRLIPWVERLIHLQIKNFIDDPNEQQKLKSLSNSAIEKVDITLTNLQDQAEKWQFFKINNEVYARSEQRNNLFFQIYSEAWSTVKFTF